MAGVAHGFFPPEEDAKIVNKINQARTDLLLVGMGVPRQERWLHQYWPDLTVTVGIGVGGLLDLWAGRSKRAPPLLEERSGMGLSGVAGTSPVAAVTRFARFHPHGPR